MRRSERRLCRDRPKGLSTTPNRWPAAVSPHVLPKCDGSKICVLFRLCSLPYLPFLLLLLQWRNLKALGRQYYVFPAPLRCPSPVPFGIRRLWVVPVENCPDIWRLRHVDLFGGVTRISHVTTEQLCKRSIRRLSGPVD